MLKSLSPRYRNTFITVIKLNICLTDNHIQGGWGGSEWALSKVPPTPLPQTHTRACTHEHIHFGSYCNCEQPKLRLACTAVQSRKSIRCLPAQSMDVDQRSDLVLDSYLCWIRQHDFCAYICNQYQNIVCWPIFCSEWNDRCLSLSGYAFVLVVACSGLVVTWVFTQLTSKIGRPSARQLNAIRMRFCWRADVGLHCVLAG